MRILELVIALRVCHGIMVVHTAVVSKPHALPTQFLGVG